MKPRTCEICPHYCSINLNECGKCQVIKNCDGVLKNIFYGRCSNISVDSIEKRPLFHFYPGTKFLSVGLYGCSASCKFCLPGNSLIKTPDGTKRMDQILDGDKIVAVCGSRSSPQFVSTHVGRVFDREVEEVIELRVGGQTIQLTPEHPILTKRGWIKAGDLLEDDCVFCVDA